MVTIREIAEAVGVSSTTVSRVLNYDPTLSVSPTTRQAVIETAEALNYATPRNRSRGSVGPQAEGALRPGSRIILFHFIPLIDEYADPYYIGVRLGIERRCQMHRLEIKKVYPGDDTPDAAGLREAAGLIVVGRHRKDKIEWLFQQNPNLVFADYMPPDERFDCVHSDLSHAMMQLLESLYAGGYRRIGLMSLYVKQKEGLLPMVDQRHQAYREWMTARALFDSALCRHGNLRVDKGFQLMKEFFEHSVLPEVLITSNDNMAIGAYRAIREHGLSIPRDIAIASFNDIPVAEFLSPPLSTVKIYAEHIGETVVDLLVERTAGRDYTKRVNVSTKMVWRDSCRLPPGGG